METTSAQDVITPKANAVLVLSTWNRSKKNVKVIFRSRRSSSLSIEADNSHQPANKPIVIGWNGEFFLGNSFDYRNLFIQVITMMISILNMAKVQVFLRDVERP